MKWKIFALLAIFAGIMACNKDKFNTTPSLKFKSVNSHIIPVNGTLLVDFEYTDKEGDISNTLTLKKIRNNKKTTATLRDSLALVVPDIPKYTKGVIEAKLDYNLYLTSAATPPKSGNPPVAESDSLTLKFYLKDKAGHVSDTVTVDNIVVQRQ